MAQKPSYEQLEQKIKTLEKLLLNQAEIEQALQNSEALFRGLYNNMPSGSAIYRVINDGSKGSDYIIKAFNAAGLGIEDLTLEDVVGKSLLDLRPNIDEFGLVAVMKKVWETGVPAYHPVTLYEDDRFQSYYENYIFKIPGGEIVTIYNDVTDQKNTEASLKNSKQRYDLALRFTSDGLFDWNLETNQIYFSPSWKKMLGYEDDELANEFSTWEELTRSEDVVASWKMLNELLEGKRERFELEFKMKHKAGHWVDILSRANATRNAEGKAVRVVGTHVDISERIQAEKREGENLACLRLAMESANEGFWETDCRTGLISFDHRTLDIMGYDQHFSTQTEDWWMKRIHPEDRSRVGRSYTDFLAGQAATYHQEFRYAAKDGEYIWFSSDASIISWDESGSPLRVVGIHRDITGKKQAAEREKEALARLRLAIDAASAGTWTWDFKDGRVFGDERMEEIFCLEKGQFPRTFQTWKDRVHPQDRDAAERATREAIEQDINYEFEYRINDGRGGWRFVNAQAVVLKDRQGQPQKMVGLTTDITKRKKVENDLRENQRQLTTVLYNLPGMAYRCANKPDWPMEFTSDGCQALTGYRPEELIGDTSPSYLDLIHPDDRQKVWEDIQAGVDEKRSFELTYRIITADGEEKWVWEQGRGVFDEQENILALEGFITDITQGRQAQEDLKSSEAKYRFISEKMADIVWILDTDFNHTYVSPSVERILGFSPEERIKMTLPEMLTPDSVKLVIDGLATEIQNDTAGADPDRNEAIEVEYYRKDGSTVWMENIVKAVRDSQGKMIGIHGVSRDTTQRRRTLKRIEGLNRLREDLLAPGSLDEKMKEVTDSVVEIMDADFARVWLIEEGDRCEQGCPHARVAEGPHACHHQDRCLHLKASSGRYTHLDGRHGRVPFGCYNTGRVAAAAEPGFVTNRVMGDERILYQAWAEELGLVSFAAYKLISHDGLPIGVLALFSRHEFSFEDENLLKSIAGTASEVIQVDKSIEALRQSHEMFLTVLDSIDATVYVADMDNYEILFMNKFMKDRFGRDLVGGVCWRDFKNEKQPCNDCTNQELLDENEQPTGVCVWEGKNPITGHLYINHDRAIKWLDGRYVRLQIGTDISKLKQLEEKLRQTQKMEAVGTLAGGIAHDFNNILAAIIGYTEISLDDIPAGMPVRGNLEQILKSSLRARDLVKQILSFSRQHEQEKRTIYLEPIVKETLKMLRATMPSTIEIERDIDPVLDPVEADPTQIHQLLLNLGSNATDAMKERGGILSVKLENFQTGPGLVRGRIELEKGKYIKLTVGDTGPGITPEIINRIFDPFFTTKQVGSGTGMGLSVVHGIVENHGGLILADSKPGKGATFEVYLPATDKPETISEMETGPDRVKGSGRILFVDDEPALTQLATRMLTRLGYEPVAYTSSLEALAEFKDEAQNFDLVITDLTMPKMTGTELAVEMLKLRPDIPIILCTGYSDQIDEAKAQKLGIRRLVMKPFSISDADRIIKEVLKT